VFTLKELVEFTAELVGKKIRVVGLNDFLARTQAKVMGVLPGKPFTMDNYLSLQVDSLCASNDLEKLGIIAQDVQSIVPLYLADTAQRNRYMALRKVS
jgi:NADH dehydrogenase